MSLCDFFRRACPACKRKGLRSHFDKRVSRLATQGVRANPAWIWFSCPACNSRFKQRHYGDGTLEPTSEQEWEKAVSAV